MSCIKPATSRQDLFLRRELRRENAQLQKSNNEVSVQLASYEVVPGNVLADCNLRRFVAMYWSAMEVEALLLVPEKCWWSIAAVPTTIVDGLEGGMLHVFKLVVQAFFGGPHVHD